MSRYRRRNTNCIKEESLKIEYKKLFGETANFQNTNIQLGRTCLGGYQYIASRGEYVSGYCAQAPTTSYYVEKELEKAISKESTIYLYEKVKYLGSEGQKLPEELLSGTYKYTFKLDTNYNYVLISKELEQLIENRETKEIKLRIGGREEILKADQPSGILTEGLSELICAVIGDYGYLL